MQDCSPKCLDFPEDEIAAMKERANDHTATKFGRAGLGRDTSQSTILILDTPMFRTTRMLFSRFAHGIKRLIIVEYHHNKAERMRKILLTEEFRNWPIEIVTGEVIEYLRSSTEKIDFIWLDLQTNRFTVAHQIKHHLTHAQCFAVTIASRGRKRGSTLAKRANALTKSVKDVMPHLVVDFGYQINQPLNDDSDNDSNETRVSKKKKHAPMHLLVYSKHWSPRDYNLGRDDRGNVFIYGYPLTRKSARARRRRAQFD